METLMIIVATLVVVFWVVCNVCVAKNYTTKEMYEDLIHCLDEEHNNDKKIAQKSKFVNCIDINCLKNIRRYK